eukprot:COSAG06_NODE_2794_length_6274_cov_2.952551_2_plen_86_part_00
MGPAAAGGFSRADVTRDVSRYTAQDNVLIFHYFADRFRYYYCVADSLHPPLQLRPLPEKFIDAPNRSDRARCWCKPPPHCRCLAC